MVRHFFPVLEGFLPGLEEIRHAPRNEAADDVFQVIRVNRQVYVLPILVRFLFGPDRIDKKGQSQLVVF